MLSVDVFGNSREEGKSDGGFDVLVTVDGRSDGLDDSFRD